MSADPDTTIIRPELPTWVKALAPLTGIVGALVALVERPVETLQTVVFEIISRYLVAAVLGLVDVVTGAVLVAFDTVVGALAFAQRILVTGASVVGVDILGALTGLQQAVASVVADAGPAAPIIAVAAAAAAVYLLYRVSIALLGELPIGSSIVDLLNLR